MRAHAATPRRSTIAPFALLACITLSCGGRVASRDGEHSTGGPVGDAATGTCETEDANVVAMIVLPVDASTCAARPTACDASVLFDDSSLRAEIDACAGAAVSCLACEYVQLATDRLGCVTGISSSHAFGEPAYVSLPPGGEAFLACVRAAVEGKRWPCFAGSFHEVTWGC